MEEPSGNSFPCQPLIGRLTRSMIPQKLQKSRGDKVSKNKVKAKRRPDVTPLRMTSCIFPRPVTRITSHPGNKTRRRQVEEKLQKSRQYCELLRLKKYQEFTCVQSSCSKKSVPVSQLVQMSLQLSPSSYSQGVTTPVALQLSPTFYRQGVTNADIRRQTQRVKQARKRLAEALEADRLARQAETMGNKDEYSEN